MTYKITGQGDIRKVLDEHGKEIGELRRHARQEIRMSFSKNSGTVSRVVVVTWTATTLDGQKVLFRNGGVKVFDRMKDWALPAAWENPKPSSLG